jgi:tripartite ATP-independent transporter DctM subunit
MTGSLTILFLVLMFLGMPVAFAIGVAFMLFYLFGPAPAMIAVQKIVVSTQNFPLLAVPLFIFAGHLMNHSGITERLIKLSTVMTGWISGGLAHVAIMLSALMGGVSGSAVADAAMEARVLGPSMVKSGLSLGFACAAMSVGSLITATIPPSVGLIIYGYLGNVSIGRLFAGGIVPGVLMTVFLMGTAYVIAKRRNYKPELASRPAFREILASAWESKWALVFPVFLIVGIRYGIFTPSEAGAFAIAYAVVIGKFVFRQLTLSNLTEALRHSVQDIGMIMLIIMLSSMIGYVITLEAVPQSAAEFLIGITSNKYVLMILIITFILIMGCLLESTVIVLLLTPILVPVMQTAGVDLVHFGLVMMTATTLGSMTPPVGVAMFAVCGIMKCGMHDYTREALPFIGTVVGLIVLMIFWPDLVLFVPDIVFGKG